MALVPPTGTSDDLGYPRFIPGFQVRIQRDEGTRGVDGALSPSLGSPG